MLFLRFSYWYALPERTTDKTGQLPVVTVVKDGKILPISCKIGCQARAAKGIGNRISRKGAGTLLAVRYKGLARLTHVDD